MEVLPRKEFEKRVIPYLIEEEGSSKEEAEKEVKGILGYHTRKHEILLPKGSSTSTKLHELGHEAYGHGRNLFEGDIKDEVIKEVEPEIYAWEMKGKRLNPRVGYQSVVQLVVDKGMDPKEAVYWVTLVLEEDFGIPVSNSEKRELIRWAKGRY